MLGKKVGIDLGTSTVRLVVKGEGVIAGEPAVVALGTGGEWTSAVGVAALDAVAAAPEQRLYRPLLGGSVVDPVAARTLISHIVTRAVGRQRIFKPDVVMAVMASLAGDQRRALLEAAVLAGARTAYLLDAPFAAALGCGMQLQGNNGHLVIDVGAGKTDIAVLALEGTIVGRSLPGHGGQRLHTCVAGHVKRTHGAELDSGGVEEVIASLLRVGPHEERRMEIRGRTADGEAQVMLTSTEFQRCLDAHVRPVATAVDEVLAETPITLREDIREEGIFLCGGGARLEGLDRALAAASGIEVHVDGEPQLCAVRGTGYALDRFDVLKRNFMYIR